MWFMLEKWFFQEMRTYQYERSGCMKFERDWGPHLSFRRIAEELRSRIWFWIPIGLYQMEFHWRPLKKRDSRSFRSQSSVNCSNNWTVLWSSGLLSSSGSTGINPERGKSSKRDDWWEKGSPRNWVANEERENHVGTQGSSRKSKTIQFFAEFTNNWERNDRRSRFFEPMPIKFHLGETSFSPVFLRTRSELWDSSQFLAENRLWETSCENFRDQPERKSLQKVKSVRRTNSWAFGLIASRWKSRTC
jgi:hypothetical protein